MTHAFISYKREDETRVGWIARALERAGVDLWWDRSLLNGENWHETISQKLQSAGCVIVVWSEASAGPAGSYVRDEARVGLKQQILVPVVIDRLQQIPLGFGELQAIDLTRWKGDVRDPSFQDLVASVRAKLSGAPAPPPLAAKARLARRLRYGAVSSAAMALISTFALNAFGVTSKVCTTPGLQPGLADACGALRIGEQPTQAERLDWEALPKGDCPALRAYVARRPDSPYRSRAADLITAGERGGAWSDTTRQVPIYIPASDGGPASNEAAARSEALDRGQAEAERICAPFGAGTIFRYVSASVTPAHWSCSTAAGNTQCGFSGQAVCRLQSQTEKCG
jgi:hypothetical protein